MLSNFDPRTIALLVVFAFFIETSAIGAQAYLIREYPGIGIALLGNISLALGFSLNIQRGSIPDYASIVLGNVLIILGPCLFYTAVCRFTDQNYKLSFILVIMAVATFCVIYFRYAMDNIGLRIATFSACAAVVTFAITFKLWLARQTTYRFSVIATLISFFLYGIFLSFRAVSALITPPQALFANTPVESATYLLLFTISFLWTIGFVLMISQRLQADLRDLATIDSLTRIPNRRAAQTFLEKELSRASRKHEPFSVLLIDIDNFKQINDQHGHAVGDHVLVKSAELFMKNIRKQDLVGRWGGEEFLVILSGASMTDAKCLAERLRSQVENTKYNDTGSITTISIGISTSGNSDSIDKMLKTADDALYVAKTTKNAVVTANTPETNKN